jgi:hypothetical protein
VEQRKLGLEDPVSKWIPEFRPRLSDGSEPVITIRNLLTHTSGLSYSLYEPENGPYHQAKVSDGGDQPGLSITENLRRLASVPLLFAPGAEPLREVRLDHDKAPNSGLGLKRRDFDQVRVPMNVQPLQAVDFGGSEPGE